MTPSARWMSIQPRLPPRAARRGLAADPAGGSGHDLRGAGARHPQEAWAGSCSSGMPVEAIVPENGLPARLVRGRAETHRLAAR